MNTKNRILCLLSIFLLVGSQTKAAALAGSLVDVVHKARAGIAHRLRTSSWLGNPALNENDNSGDPVSSSPQKERHAYGRIVSFSPDYNWPICELDEDKDAALVALVKDFLTSKAAFPHELANLTLDYAYDHGLQSYGMEWPENFETSSMRILMDRGIGWEVMVKKNSRFEFVKSCLALDEKVKPENLTLYVATNLEGENFLAQELITTLTICQGWGDLPNNLFAVPKVEFLKRLAKKNEEDSKSSY